MRSPWTSRMRLDTKPPISACRNVTVLMSDVPGDDPIEIASGPTVADPTR